MVDIISKNLVVRAVSGQENQSVHRNWNRKIRDDWLCFSVLVPTKVVTCQEKERK
jgi:hypothetical protein